MEATLWPYGKCKKCANKNYCAWSESEILNCMNNGYPNFSPMRNADRIRAMTDEELAKLFQNLCCPYSLGGRVDCNIESRGCGNCWLSWLKSPVEVEK